MTVYQLTGLVEVGLILELFRLRIIRSNVPLLAYLLFDVFQVAIYDRLTLSLEFVLAVRLVSACLAVWVSGWLVSRLVADREGLRTVSRWTFRFVMPLLLAASATVLVMDIVGPERQLNMLRTDMLERVLYGLSLLTTCFGAGLTIWFRLAMAWNVRVSLVCWFAWNMTMQAQLVTWLAMASRSAVANLVSGVAVVMIAGLWALGLRRSGETRPASAVVGNGEAEEAMRLLRQAADQLQASELRRSRAERNHPDQ